MNELAQLNENFTDDFWRHLDKISDNFKDVLKSIASALKELKILSTNLESIIDSIIGVIISLLEISISIAKYFLQKQ
ncbi:hypothetical protein Xsto_00984 [Xenorhabdus stockiae]|uniref:Uncharacterized protein n=1 Tax=Xenorhabdus stockiae TaxID=351614 RepID=A0A2D0KTK6_9GAMM|nr:hypothetical protein [Xenorhabdus stockiae]PHM66655.1 hypothetical protein Xsto_00984 [Xenorhabdus stockiae]